MVDILATIICVVFGLLGMTISGVMIFEDIREIKTKDLVEAIFYMAIEIVLLIISAGMFFIGVAV